MDYIGDYLLVDKNLMLQGLFPSRYNALLLFVKLLGYYLLLLTQVYCAGAKCCVSRCPASPGAS
jgi:hypothetical protein